jgi:signal transduction histidine kinase
MEQKICIYVCSAYYPEVSGIVDSGNYPDVVLKTYAFNCLCPIKNKIDFNISIEESKKSFSKIIVIAGSCSHGGRSDLANQKKLVIHELNYCMELLLNRELIEHYIGRKYYLVSNGWLSDYMQHIVKWGFDEDSVKKFFKESTDKILLLETGIRSEYRQQIEALSKYMGLPYEIIPVGLSHCRLLIETLVCQWRKEHDKNQIAIQIADISKKNADYALIYDQMLHMVDLTDEIKIIQQIFVLLDILFAPRNISFTSRKNGNNEDTILFHPDIQVNSENNDSSFTIDVLHRGNIIGSFRISDVNFAEHIEKYKPLEEVISRMSGLIITNARKYKIIQDNEDQLKKNKIELTAVNETKDKFFSIIAHDLRGPIGAFTSLSQLLAEEYKTMNPDEIKEISGLLVESSNNLFSLLENLLVWSRMQRGMIEFKPESLPLLPNVIEGIGLISDPARKKSIEINYLIPADLMVYADKRMFDTVIRNLVSNAIKFTPGGGNISVSATAANDYSVEIRIKDSGIGMPPEMIEKLFKIGEKTSRPGTDGEPSTGLGLLLCKEFIEKNNGKIWAESEERKGSSFCFTLPSVS